MVILLLLLVVGVTLKLFILFVFLDSKNNFVLRVFEDSSRTWKGRIIALSWKQEFFFHELRLILSPSYFRREAPENFWLLLNPSMKFENTPLTIKFFSRYSRSFENCVGKIFGKKCESSTRPENSFNFVLVFDPPPPPQGPWCFYLGWAQFWLGGTFCKSGGQRCFFGLSLNQSVEFQSTAPLPNCPPYFAKGEKNFGVFSSKKTFFFL